MKVRKRMDIGEYIVSDPKICSGDLTFKGTRILVKDVLYFVAKGLDWDSISKEYHGLIGREAIAEAVRLASAAFVEKNATQRDDKSATIRRYRTARVSKRLRAGSTAC